MTVKEFGAIIKKRRKELGITSYALQANGIIHAHSLRKLEDGKGLDMRFSTLQALCAYLKLEINIRAIELPFPSSNDLQD